MPLEDFVFFNFIISVIGLAIIWAFALLYIYKIDVLTKSLKEGMMKHFFNLMKKTTVLISIIESGIFLSAILDFRSGGTKRALDIRYVIPPVMVILAIALFTLGWKILSSINSMAEEKKYG